MKDISVKWQRNRESIEMIWCMKTTDLKSKQTNPKQSNQSKRIVEVFASLYSDTNFGENH